MAHRKYNLKAKDNGKVYRTPTRASPRLPALRAQAAVNPTSEIPVIQTAAISSAFKRKPRMRVKFFTKQLAPRDYPLNIASFSTNPINISSDSEAEDSEEDPKEENPKMDSEEAPEYIPGAEPIEEAEEIPEYDLEEEDPEEDPEEALNGEQEEDSEEPEEDPEEDPIMNFNLEDEEMEEEAEQDLNDDDKFLDYFKLAPPPSPDSSYDSD
ncbi:hypothetical protein PIB30_036232 [Stylosanthes scabra]|uniref:Uncharacterized protein n=1 Tax=Stylosanthes scabra TaxID=79078 RepID=A0ABU6WD14_9FABA|nr:hypothetical protein [Stylosanthes scabra]